jgi:hypothetical protein
MKCRRRGCSVASAETRRRSCHEKGQIPFQAEATQLRAEAQVKQGQGKGRVEHLNSGEAEHFASLEELLAFMARVLTEWALAERPPEEKG